jgi:anti-sigma regulatory factor (Ser/Thr protein kinase)
MTADIDVPLDVQAPRKARHAMVPILRAWGFADPAWLYAAEVVVSELIANAVKHGGGCRGLTLELRDGQVTISAADGSAVVPRRREPAVAGNGGGLVLIERLSQRWGVALLQRGKRVWALLPALPRPVGT